MPHQKLKLNPNVIALNELGAEGQRYTYDQNTGELNESLADLIGKNPYKVTLEVKPTGNVFTAQGRIETSMDLLCSLCAVEIKQSINENFNEILIIQSEMDRISKTARVNHSSELNSDGPNCTELETDQFDVGEFVHELVALAEPIKPVGSSECGSTCTNYQEALKSGWLTPEDQAAFAKQKPFEVLKGLKLNS